MSNFRKLKSKINKKFIKYGLEPVNPKGLSKDSRERIIEIDPLDYGYIMDDYLDTGNIYMVLTDETSEENHDLFKLKISGGFGVYRESEEYIVFDKEILGSSKDILKFFEELAKELSFDFTSIKKLITLIYNYRG